ncbi:MAG: hypothetical protein ACKO3C_09315 [Betaproteobacteria bacterium]
MEAAGRWVPLDSNASAILAACPQPLWALADAQVPALIIRSALSAVECEALVTRLAAKGQLPDPNDALPARLLDRAIPEGFYREGRDGVRRYAWKAVEDRSGARIDVGTSLGYRGSDPAAYFAHSAETIRLFDELFGLESAVTDPVRALYEALQSLAGARQVSSAREEDGRSYGPAIVRAHYGGYSYAPHFDSVRLREKRSDFAVHAFRHQFAGVLVLQNARLGNSTAQCTIHRCLWEPEIDPHLKAGTFHDYARERALDKTTVHLEPGDVYFFNTRCIHEVPGLIAATPRIVLATFIGFDEDRDVIYVWS